MNLKVKVLLNKKLLLVISAACFVISCSQAQETGPPNIVVIIADDLGFSDLGCYGGEIETPNLDKLADNGLRFTQFNNTGRCWPSRAALLTGYYPQQVGRDNAPGISGGGGPNKKRPEWATLVPKYLEGAGYRSYHTGKWHMDGMPIKSGFDRSYYLKDQGRFFSPKTHYEDDQKLPAVERGTGYYSTVEIANKTINYLKEHQTNFADKPFFSYVAFSAPHFPLHALPEDIEAVGDRYASGWNELRQKRWERIQEMGIVTGELSTVESDIGPPYHFPKALEILGKEEVNRPVAWDSLSKAQQKFQQDKMTIHAAMVERMDKEIGRIIAQLKEMDALENTLIVFLSDNGASAEIMVRADGHDREAARGSASSYLCLGPGWSTMCNTPFRRHKTWSHEGGNGTPFIAHWPEGIAAKGELRKSHGHITDIVPTMLDLAGVSPNEQQHVAFPGQSLSPVFEQETNWEHPIWYYHAGNRAMRAGDWKLVASKDEPWELYNLKEDRTESSDLASQQPNKVIALEKQWTTMLEEFRKVSPYRKEVVNEVPGTIKNLE